MPRGPRRSFMLLQLLPPAMSLLPIWRMISNMQTTALPLSKSTSFVIASTKLNFEPLYLNLVLKVLVEETKKELSRIQAELSSTNRNLNFSDQQIEAISTKLPLDKSDLKTFFPKAWCDQNGEGVINAAQKEFKGHVEEMEKQRGEEDIAGGDEGWAAAFDEDNFNPRAFSDAKGKKVQESLDSFGGGNKEGALKDSGRAISSTNRNLNFSAWCHQHRDGMINTAQEEFKGRVEEMKKRREEDIAGGGEGWGAAFEEDDFNPRAFS
ncbi:hypothetical protein TRIUR3_21778 [Triticum urartu]|uniref:Uncharacterized protein n=1 Tax=Triticum urartu TaxID=4572 RepID=M7ZDQ5_TRIUA|nr:hypothetical protein TRIUR3_21778 [Triticum urartu]